MNSRDQMAFGKKKQKQQVAAELEEARDKKRAERPRKGGAPIIEMRDVSKVYSGGHLALDRVSLAVNRGDFVFLVGPSGCGKSTLIKLLIRELEPTDGSVSIAGRPPKSASMAWVMSASWSSKMRCSRRNRSAPAKRCR